MSEMFTSFLRQQLAVREGYLHVLWADPQTAINQAQFAVMFAPSDADGFMKPRYCRGAQEVTHFLEKLGVTAKAIETILETVSRERSASERISLPQAVIQMFEPLADRVEYGLLQIAARSRLGSVAGHQNSWGGWMNSVAAIVPECTQADLLSAFKRLRSRKILRLTKPDSVRYEGVPYSGRESDDNEFFFTAPFNAVLTDEGRSYLDRIPI